jgi:hypothetical protein
MSSRLHTALVYVGLVQERGIDAELRAAPMNLRRVAALAIALCLGAGLALALLWLIGADVSWRTPVAFMAFFGVAYVVARAARRFNEVCGR